MSGQVLDAAPFPAETYLTHDELCELTDEQKAAYVSFTMERFDRVAMEFVDALVHRWGGGVPVSVETLEFPVEQSMEVVHVCDSLGDVAEVHVVTEPLLLPVHGHSASPVRSGPGAGNTCGSAEIVQEVGGSPVAARAGACECAAPAESSPENEDAPLLEQRGENTGK